jgi:hypothetical protein
VAVKLLTERDAGVCPVTEAVDALTGPTALPELASVPLTVAPSDMATAEDTVQDQVNWMLLPPPTFWGGVGLGEPQLAAPPGLTVGVTEVTRAPAWPVSLTVRVTDTAWPTSAVLRLATAPALRTAAVWTVTLACGLALAPTAPPLLASVPETLPPRVRVPAAEGVQVQAKVPLLPPAMVRLDGLAAVQLAATPVADGVTVVTLAEAPPVLVTVRVRESCWPVLAVVTPPPTAMVAVSAALLWTVTLAGVAVAFTAAPELASVPLTVAPRLRDPVVVGVQLQVKVPEPPPAIAWLAGLAAVQVALAVPPTVGAAAPALAVACPVLFTVSVKETAWLTFTVPWPAATLPLSTALAWTVTPAPVTVGLMLF